MIDHRAVDLFVARQLDLLRQSYDRAWRRGRDHHLSGKGRLTRIMARLWRRGGPDDRRREHSMAPAARSLEKMRLELKGLVPSPEQIAAAARVVAAGSLPGASTAAVAEQLALRRWITANASRLAGGASVVWAGEQAGYAESADRGNELLRWQTVSDARVCPTCVAYGLEPPRPLRLWPTSPGAGDTQCSVGCRCGWETVGIVAG